MRSGIEFPFDLVLLELPFEIWNWVSIEKAWLSFFGWWDPWTALIRGDY